MHAVEVAFERIHVSGPEPAERSEPGLDFLKWFRPQPVEHGAVRPRWIRRNPPRAARAGASTRLAVACELTLDLAHRLFGRDEQAQYRAAVRLGDDVEHRFHSTYILIREYACQGTYGSARKQLRSSPNSGAEYLTRSSDYVRCRGREAGNTDASPISQEDSKIMSLRVTVILCISIGFAACGGNSAPSVPSATPTPPGSTTITISSGTSTQTTTAFGANPLTIAAGTTISSVERRQRDAHVSSRCPAVGLGQHSAGRPLQLRIHLVRAIHVSLPDSPEHRWHDCRSVNQSDRVPA